MIGRTLSSKQRTVKAGLIWFSMLTLSWSAACQKEDTSDKRRLPLESVSGSFIVEMKDDDSTISDRKAELLALAKPLATTHGCRLESPEEILWETDQTGVLPSSLSYIFHLNFAGCSLSQKNTDQIMDSLAESNSVQTIEANPVMTTMVTESDPLKSRQYYLGSVNRDQACLRTGGQHDKPVIVAIVDSGVERNHPDLIDQFYRDQNGQIIGANFVGKGSRGEPDARWDDDNGHGTHVAGLVGASANNNEGIAGVASCANIKIMPIRVMDADGRGNSLEIDRGIQWAAARGADIINLSLGSNSIVASKQSSQKKALYENLAGLGVIVFAAAGNDGMVNGSAYREAGRQGFMYSYPASYDNVIAVGSTNSSNALSIFSNRGERVDIAAPGSDTLSTYPGRTYRNLSGTSMASPVAAGTYALALAAVRYTGQEKLFFDDVRELFMIAVSKNASFNNRDVIAGGVVNADQLVDLLQKRFPAPVAEQPAEPEQPIVPDYPGDQQPENPGTEGFLFVGLQPGQKLTGSIFIAMQQWPQGTARINVYWLTGQEWFPRPFMTFDRQNLTPDGRLVVSKDRYLLYGKRYLVAEAVDSNGRQLQQKSMILHGH